MPTQEGKTQDNSYI